MRNNSMTVIERFLKYVAISELGCWLWQGSLDTKGYGSLWDGEHNVRAHRFAHEYYKGIIPKGLEPDHLCRNRSCVNPNHIEIVTHLENVRRGVVGINMRSKTHCPKGHPYTMENTYIAPHDGSRYCKTCKHLSNAYWNGKRHERHVQLLRGEMPGKE